MKIRNIIDRNEVIWFSLMALPLRLVSTSFTKKYENYTLGSVKLSYILWEYSIFTIFLIFVYGIMLKKTARETTGYAKVESSPKIPLIRSFFIYLGIGEVLNFIACLIPYSITMFGRYTAYPAYSMYIIFYIKDYNRYNAMFIEHAWTLKDFLMFIPFYLICEIFFIIALIFVFKICCNRYMYKDSKKIMAYDNFEYTVYSFFGRFIAFGLYYWAIKNYVEDVFTVYSVAVSLIIPIVILRFYLKYYKERFFEARDNKSILKSVIKLILPGEIFMFFLGITAFGIDYVYRFGKGLAYPAYALYRFLYGTVSGRMGEINAGNIIFADYIFYILCYSVYLVLFTYLMYLTAKSAIKVKYRYA